jgi:hypothetical protein
VLVSRLHAAAGALFPPKGEEEKSKVEPRRHAANSVSTPRKRDHLRVARRWDSDKTIARGSAPGTRAGRAVRLHSRPASRDVNAERPSRLEPPREALAVFRPRFSLLRPRQWIAVTPEAVEARAGDRFVVVRRSDIQALHVERRVVFAGPAGRALGSVPAVYSTARIEALAAVLGVRVTSR